MATNSRPDGRRDDELRPVNIVPDWLKHPAGSALVEMGDTRVLCSASVLEGVPEFLQGTGKGWVTAEYGMLPGSTNRRKERGEDSRMVEIRRLIGRCIRAATDLERLGERTFVLDCDVLQADGGTRTAAVTGAFAALGIAVKRLLASGEISRHPVRSPVSAVSVGLVEGEALLDLCYGEDAAAQVDMNVAMTADGGLVDVQATAEGGAFGREAFGELLDLAAKGCRELCSLQRRVVAEAPAGGAT